MKNQMKPNSLTLCCWIIVCLCFVEPLCPQTGWWIDVTVTWNGKVQWKWSERRSMLPSRTCRRTRRSSSCSPAPVGPKQLHIINITLHLQRYTFVLQNDEHNTWHGFEGFSRILRVLSPTAKKWICASWKSHIIISYAGHNVLFSTISVTIYKILFF